MALPAEHAVARDRGRLERGPHEHGDGPEVLRDHARALRQDREHALAVAGLRGLSGGHERGLAPVRREEVRPVQADDVVHAVEPVQIGHAAPALGEPAEPVLLHHVPAVDREPPVLAGGAEGVRGDPDARVEAEVLAPGPHVRRVGRDHERQVTGQLDARGVRRPAGRVPLLLRLPLDPGVEQDAAREAGARLGERGGVAVAQAGGPLGPRAAALVAVVDRDEEGVVVEPGRLLARERLERARADGAAAPLLELEAAERELERAPLQRADVVPPDRRRRAHRGEQRLVVARERGDAAGRVEVLERPDADVHRVDREGGERRVRARLPARGLVHREHLRGREPRRGAPARPRDEVRDLADPPVGGRADGEERKEDAGLSGHGWGGLPLGRALKNWA